MCLITTILNPYAAIIEKMDACRLTRLNNPYPSGCNCLATLILERMESTCISRLVPVRTEKFLIILLLNIVTKIHF